MDIINPQSGGLKYSGSINTDRWSDAVKLNGGVYSSALFDGMAEHAGLDLGGINQTKEVAVIMCKPSSNLLGIGFGFNRNNINDRYEFAQFNRTALSEWRIYLNLYVKNKADGTTIFNRKLVDAFLTGSANGPVLNFPKNISNQYLVELPNTPNLEIEAGFNFGLARLTGTGNLFFIPYGARGFNVVDYK